MRQPALILTVLAASLLIAPASPREGADPPPKDQKEESAMKIKELQKERLATLEALVDATTRLYQQARVEYGEVIATMELLFKAQLEVAEKESDRITLYKKMVDMWKQSEELAKQRAEAARGTMVAVLRFKALRLEAEINLERAKAREAKESK